MLVWITPWLLIKHLKRFVFSEQQMRETLNADGVFITADKFPSSNNAVIENKVAYNDGDMPNAEQGVVFLAQAPVSENQQLAIKPKALRNTLPQIIKCRWPLLSVFMPRVQVYLFRYCPKTFFYRRYVRKHERLQHELPAELQGEPSALVFHLKNADIYKIRCPLCVKRFCSQRLLKQHLAFHNRAEKMDDC